MLITPVEMLVEQSGGKLISGDEHALITSLAIDSRAVKSGSVFVAFSGVNVDGHVYLEDAITSGARALIITKPLEELSQTAQAAIEESNISVVLVKNALTAVSNLGAAHRNRFRCPVIGVTGSTGKTTTKDLLAAVLGAKYQTIATEKNHNNELGVPLTLLSGTPETEAFVIEMGMRGSGEIADLCRIARPTMGLITNVGTSHIEFLGSEQAIAAAKAELLASISVKGRAFINGDDAQSEYLKTTTEAPVTTYGLGVKNDICAENIVLDEMSRPSFLAICEDSEPFEVTLNVPGRHNVYNALAALAVGYHCGVPAKDMVDALARAQTTSMRMEVLVTAGNVTVLNDTYNANPTSMRAALDTLEEITTAKKKIAVLGGMGELGSLETLAHFDLGKYVAEKRIDVLIGIGELARRICDGAIAGGKSAQSVLFCETIDEAAASLDALVETEDAVLVKASRLFGLEEIVERIVNPRA